MWEDLARRANEDLEGFWAAEAAELEWYRPWDRVLDDSNKPFYQWFVGMQVMYVLIHSRNSAVRQADDLKTLPAEKISAPSLVTYF